MTPVLANLYQALTTSRESSDTAARALAGEQVEQPMDMGLGAEQPPSGELPPPEGEQSDLDVDTDGFDATDAAVGGEEELGRERR
jgi:hypothetical protein